MSLLKWTLAMAGTAMGLRYLSERHRQRLSVEQDRPARTDRDGGQRTDTPWATPQNGGGGVSGLDAAGTRTGTPGSSGATRVVQDDPLASGSTLPPGSSSSNSF